MPVREFQCTKCGDVEEMMLKMDDPLTYGTCKSCGGITKKIISQSTFHLKGGGWADQGYSSAKKVS